MTKKNLLLLQGIVPPIASLLAAFIPYMVDAAVNHQQKNYELSIVSKEKLSLDDKLYDRLRQSLSSVKGQEKAITDIIASICGWSESKKNTLDLNSGGLIIHMAGESGVGKSMTANILTNELSNRSAIRIKYSDINTADPRSCAQQLFGSYTKNKFKENVKCNTRFAAQLIHNPEVVVQIDEFDKFMLRDDSLQTMLWDISDTGYLKIDNDKPIKCNKTIFILTSNASKESLKIDFDKTKNIDNSNSLESVNFKQAFLNRITSVYFENFSQEIYKEIFLEKFKPIKEYYSKNYGMVLNFNDNTLSDISKKLSEAKTGGARNVGIFTSKLYNAINLFRRENHIETLSKENKKLKSPNKETYNLNILYKDDHFEIKNAD